MALYTTPPSYGGANSAAPFSGAVRNIGMALMQRPYLQAMANQRAAMANYYGARANELGQVGKEADARTALLQAQTDATRQKTASSTNADATLMKFGDLTRKFMAAQQAFRGSPTPENQKVLEDATSDMAGGAGSLKNMKVGDLTAALGRMRAQNELAAPQPDFARAGGYEGQAASVANENTRAGQAASRPMIIPTGGTMASPDGQVLATGGVTLSPGQQRFSPQSVTADGTPGMGTRLIASGAPMQPKTSAIDTARAQLAAKLLETGDNDVTNKLAQFGRMVPAPAAQPATSQVPGAAPAGTNAIPPGAAAFLRANPHLAPQFEAKYGQGTAAQILGQ